MLDLLASLSNTLSNTLAATLPPTPDLPLPGASTEHAGDLGGWLHTLDPFVFRIQGDLGVRWYGLAYLVGMALGYVVLAVMCAKRLVGIPRERLIDVFLLIVIGVLVGGRLGYVLFYQPSLLWSFSPGFPWWGVFEINRGGMASHGGVLGVLGAALLASRGFRNDDGTRSPGPRPMTTLDGAALVTPIGLGLGRIANFINAELLGRIVAQPGQPAPWWAVRFPQELTAGHGDITYTPAQQAALDRLLAQHARDPLEPIDATMDRIIRRLSEGDPQLVERITPLLSARVPSQLIQAFAEGLVLLVVLWIVAAKPRKPGVISAVFLIAYGLLRVVTEIWRLPDAHLIAADSAHILGLSRGQLLSVGMVLTGIALLWFFQTRKTGLTPEDRNGGWWTRRTRPDPAPTGD